MFVLFAMGLEIAVSLGVVGVLGLLWLKGWTVGLGVVGSVAWSNATSFSFIAVPLFVFMSAILLHSGIGRGLFTAVARWVGFLPGGLAVASVFSCAIFAAVSGSSVATAATIGMIAIPEMERRGYGRPLICGSLAAGGTLGILIPPSIPMIIYGVMTETSVGHLYMAGIVPGVILSLMFAVAIVLYAVARPEAAPRLSEDRGSLRDKVRSVVEVAPVAVLIVVVLGGMYVGVVTPTEAAALGSTVSLVLAALARGLTWRALNRAFQETVRTTSMVVLIIIVWLEIGFITPPVGLNLFVIQGLMPGLSGRQITLGTTPFVVLMILLVVLLFLVPDLALWLPRRMLVK